jgi:hypothetical protein
MTVTEVEIRAHGIRAGRNVSGQLLKFRVMNLKENHAALLFSVYQI